jgi:hypothetical protein
MQSRHKVMTRDHHDHPDGLEVAVNAGMMTVLPAWKIADLLDDPRVREPRELLEARARETLRGGRPD